MALTVGQAAIAPRRNFYWTILKVRKWSIRRFLCYNRGLGRPARRWSQTGGTVFQLVGSPQNGAHYVLFSLNCPDQTVHRVFKQTKQRHPAISLLPEGIDHVVIVVSWKPDVYPVVRKEQKRVGPCSKDAKSADYRSP